MQAVAAWFPRMEVMGIKGKGEGGAQSEWHGCLHELCRRTVGYCKLLYPTKRKNRRYPTKRKDRRKVFTIGHIDYGLAVALRGELCIVYSTMDVLKIMPVTTYGSMLDAGRRSSK